MDNSDRIMILIAILVSVLPALILVFGLIIILYLDVSQSRDIICTSDNIRIILIPGR